MSATLKELDPAQGDRRRWAGHLRLVGQVQEILPQLFLGQLGWVAVEMSKQLADRTHVAFLGSCRIARKLSSVIRCRNEVITYPLSGRAAALLERSVIRKPN